MEVKSNELMYSLTPDSFEFLAKILEYLLVSHFIVLSSIFIRNAHLNWLPEPKNGRHAKHKMVLKVCRILPSALSNLFDESENRYASHKC